MSLRLTMTAAAAVVLASFSLFTVIGGTGWLYAGAGAAATVAAAGLATRLAAIPAAAWATGLTLIAVVPLLAGPTWAARISGLVLIAIMAASAGIRRILPAVAGLGTYLAALLIYLNLVFASAQSAVWIIPTARSLRHLAHLASLGYAEHNFAPPVPGISGIELVAAAGIGLVAVITDLLAVRLRSPAVAGLPLLILFSVPVASNVKHAGLGLTLAFCLGITGYLTLLATDGRQRLRLWGRLVTVWQDAADDEPVRGPDTKQLAASGRRVGLAAVAFAVVVPLALPSLKQHGIFGRSSVPGHGSQVAPPQPLVQMRSQLLANSAQPFLTYTTTAPDPPQQYLQVYVLNYDAGSGSWTLTSRDPATSVGTQTLRPVPGLASGTSFTTSQTTVTIGRAAGYTSQLSYLPLPYAPQFLKVGGNGWLETESTLMVYGYRPDASLRYTVTSRTATPTKAQLVTKAPIPASVRPYQTYQGPDKSRLTELARQITSGSRTPFDKAVALENWFTEPGRFTYTLHGNLPTSVYQFLTRDKRGFCQQFAFAMAVLARLIGIPSRIAVGYTAGSLVGHHTWKVTTADAHAWPELYFPGAGWLRFEPTPGGAAGGTATRPVYTSSNPAISPAGPADPTTGRLTTPGNGQSNVLPRIKAPVPGGQASSAQARKAASGTFPLGLVAAIVAGLLIIGPGTARLAARRRRWLTAAGDADRAHAAWREMNSDLADHGLGGAASESPRAVGRRITDAVRNLDKPAREAMDRIVAAEERARYARTPTAADSLRADAATVRRAVARNAGRRQRWRARLLPASILTPTLAGLRQVADVFGWLDAAGLRIRRSLSQTVRARRAG